MSFDVIANGWRKLINKETKTIPCNVRWMATQTVDSIGTIFMTQNLIPIVEGNTYAVTTDSGTFTAVCKKFLIDGVEGLTVGCMEMLKTGVCPEGGESFLYTEATIPEEGPMAIAYDFNHGNTFTIAEVERTETIKDEYFPKGGVGYYGMGAIYPKRTVELFAGEEDETVGAELEYVKFTVGETYIVELDGENYKRVCQDINRVVDENYEGEPLPVLGNLALFGENLSSFDTGEPFILIDFEGTIILGANATVGAGEHSFAVYGNVIHTIDPKFISGHCLPVVNMTTKATSAPTILTATESKQMDAIVSTKLPCIVRLLSNDNFALIFEYFTQFDAHGYLAKDNVNDKKIIVGLTGDGWQIYTM